MAARLVAVGALALAATALLGPSGGAAATGAAASSTTTSTVRVHVSGAPLEGIVVGIDPGHNGRNWSDPTYINRPVWNGRNWETCDTTGTATDAGYTEAQFNWNVAVDTMHLLEHDGARVVLTRHSNEGVGPCVTTRARILDRAKVDLAFDIHADGGPPSGRGFAILVPVADGWNRHVIRPSLRLARDLRSAFRTTTGMPYSTYDGVDAIQPRDNLAGLNLTTVPKVLIECGNMRNATDAALLVTKAFQLRAARALVLAVAAFEGRALR